MKQLLIVIILLCNISAMFSQTRQILLPDIPTTLTTPTERASYLLTHYWDNLNINDKSLINNKSVTEQAFVNYITIFPIVSDSVVWQSCSMFMKKIEKSDSFKEYILSLSKKYFYDYQSPYCNDSYLTMIMKSTELSENWIQLYELVRKNNPGSVAIPIEWRQKNDSTMTLSEIESDYIILFFNDIECTSCNEVKDKLKECNLPEGCIIISIYTEDNIKFWKSRQNNTSSNWISGYDAGMKITLNNLYDIKRKPTLYLLDKNKKVLLKDTSIEKIMEVLVR